MGAGARAACAIAAWVVVAAVALGGLGALVDGGLLVTAGATGRGVLGGAGAALALGALLAAVLAPGLAVASAVVARAARHAGAAAAWRAAIAGAGAVPLVWVLGDPLRLGWEPLPIALAAATVAGVAAAAWSSRAPRAQALVIGGSLLAGALAFDVWLEPSVYPELHDQAHLVGGAAALALLTGWRDRLRARGPAPAIALAAGVVVVAAALAAAVDHAAPGWRGASFRCGRHAMRLVHAVHLLWDRDGDGFSPLAWGADCDDGDPDVHPHARDLPGGGDANCNGVDPPAATAPAELGLAPDAGDPMLQPGAIDLFVLITVDTLRADAATPELMPRLARAAAERGAWFERAYAAGTATSVSLPLLHRADDDAEPLAVILARADIDVAAVVAPPGIRASTHGFRRAVSVEDDAELVTDAAIAELERLSRPAFLWVHYYDPHASYELHAEPAVPEHGSALPRAYRSEVAYVDRAIGRLLDHVAGSEAPDRAAVLVTSDHGEAFGEHGMRGHGRGSYEILLRVPAVLLGPGLPRGPRSQLVTHRDVPATVAGAFGLAAPARAAERFGRSWWRLRAAPDAPLHSFVVARSDRMASGRSGHVRLGVVIAPPFKLVASFQDHLLELFDVDADPGERRDLVTEEPDVARALWRQLALFCDVDGYPQ